VRSRAAAAIVLRAGFKEVYSMEGGIKAWNGFVAKGAPQAGMAYFDPAKKPEELIALAWMLEDGSRQFYSATAGMLQDRETVSFLQKLSSDEEGHKTSLFNLYRELSDLKADSGFPASLIPLDPGVKYIEGGIPLSEAMEWVNGKNLQEILELCISMEINSEDLYIKMERKVNRKEAKQVFKLLSVQEKNHLERLVRLLEKKYQLP
jgi:rubrerythrin